MVTSLHKILKCLLLNGSLRVNYSSTVALHVIQIYGGTEVISATLNLYCGHNLVTCGHNLITCGHNLVTCGHDLLT